MAKKKQKSKKSSKKLNGIIKLFDCVTFEMSYVRIVRVNSQLISSSTATSIPAGNAITFTVSLQPASPNGLTAEAYKTSDGTSINPDNTQALPTGAPTGNLWQITFNANTLASSSSYVLRVVGPSTSGNQPSAELDFTTQ